MKISLILSLILISSSAGAQTYKQPYSNDLYGSYGSVPTVTGRIPGESYQGSYQQKLDNFKQQQQEQNTIKQELNKQLNNMSPSQRMGYQQPIPLGN